MFCQVLDAPALQDDFYLNLVDWSAQNVLAVGLGNCVYLWNACSSKVSLFFFVTYKFLVILFVLMCVGTAVSTCSDVDFFLEIQQVTKLCDLGTDDSVCSVGWAVRGTHLAVGTSTGKVQVRSHLLFVYVLFCS